MRWRLQAPPAPEVLIAAALTVALQLQLALSGHWTPGRMAAALLITVPIALRSRLPLLVVGLVVAGVVVEAALGTRAFIVPVFPIIAILLALQAVGSGTTGMPLAVGGAVTLMGLVGATLLSGSDSASFVVDVLVTAGGLPLGGALRALRFESDSFAERASELERERDKQARLAVAEERRRIARELHDVIGHSISVMGLQAGAVRSILREDQGREREALMGVERTGRDAVGEMRRLIGLLRSDQSGIGDPTPSLRRLEGLVTEMRDAGLSVCLSVEGDLAGISPGIDLAGFRIVQEALTNALKHAQGANVEVRVSCTDCALEIQVSDDGTRPPRTPADHVGHGLLGMRERAALYGGDLVAGPRPTGGFAVHARLPLEVA